MAKRPGHRVLAWIGCAVTMAGLAFCVLGPLGVLPLVFLLWGCILVVVGCVLWSAALLADGGDDDPDNPVAVGSMGARGGL